MSPCHHVIRLFDVNSDGCVEKEELERVATELSKLGEVDNDNDNDNDNDYDNDNDKDNDSNDDNNDDNDNDNDNDTHKDKYKSFQRCNINYILY